MKAATLDELAKADVNETLGTRWAMSRTELTWMVLRNRRQAVTATGVACGSRCGAARSR
jgi:hypothetical protein